MVGYCPWLDLSSYVCHLAARFGSTQVTTSLGCDAGLWDSFCSEKNDAPVGLDELVSVVCCASSPSLAHFLLYCSTTWPCSWRYSSHQRICASLCGSRALVCTAVREGGTPEVWSTC